MRLVWNKKAKTRFAEILDYIESEFGENSREYFRARTKEFTQVLKQFPEIGVLELRDKNIRAFQLSKQTRIYYRVKGDRITILTFFDSKWDPRKKPR